MVSGRFTVSSGSSSGIVVVFEIDLVVFDVDVDVLFFASRSFSCFLRSFSSLAFLLASSAAISACRGRKPYP